MEFLMRIRIDLRATAQYAQLHPDRLAEWRLIADCFHGCDRIKYAEQAAPGAPAGLVITDE